MAYKALVIDDDKLRLRRRVFNELRHCCFWLFVFGTFEALARTSVDGYFHTVSVLRDDMR